MKRILALASIGAVLVASCVGRDSQDPTTTALPEEPFELLVSPSEYAPVMVDQLFVVVVSVDGGTGPVTVSAEVTGEADVTPASADVMPDEVAEYTLVARPASVGTSLTLNLIAERNGVTDTHAMPVEVVEWTDDLEARATELRERFVAYLAENHPEFSINPQTEWTPTITKPRILVVMHYLFFSEDWEMGIMWHVTIPEHAWSRMYLRPRDAVTPTFGLEIPSYSDPTSQPAPWQPPTEVDR